MKLNHDWKNTGTAQGHYFEGGVKHRVQPDICGTYHGQPFVVDTKLKDNSYVDRRDIDKVYRDAEVLGGDCKPVMVNSGPLISKVRESAVLYTVTHAMKLCYIMSKQVVISLLLSYMMEPY